MKGYVPIAHGRSFRRDAISIFEAFDGSTGYPSMDHFVDGRGVDKDHTPINTNGLISDCAHLTCQTTCPVIVGRAYVSAPECSVSANTLHFRGS